MPSFRGLTTESMWANALTFLDPAVDPPVKPEERDDELYLRLLRTYHFRDVPK